MDRQHYIVLILLCVSVIMLSISGIIKGYKVTELNDRVELLENNIIIESGESGDVD